MFVLNDGNSQFHALRNPTTEKNTAIAENVCKRVTRLLAKRGQWVNDVVSAAAPTVLEQLGAATAHGMLVFKQGQRPMKMFGAASGTMPKELKGYSFDINARTRLTGHDRKGLEKLCRYILRPPIANDRIKKLADGRFELKLKRAWSDGTSHLVFDGVELVAASTRRAACI